MSMELLKEMDVAGGDGDSQFQALEVGRREAEMGRGPGFFLAV